MIELYLLRHSQTSYNVKAEVIGGRSSGLTLTRLGTELATTAGKELRNSGLRFDRIFCSTAVRARQTLECMGLISAEESDAVVYSDCLEELYQGEWEGRPRNEIYTPEVVSCLNRENPFFRPPGGESQNDVEKRMTDFIKSEILDRYEDGASCFPHPTAHPHREIRETPILGVNWVTQT